MDDDTAYMELVKANNQGELLALEIGIHALATVNDKAKKGGGVRAYAEAIGKGEDSLKQWIGAAKVYGFLCDTSRTSEINEKPKHLYEISKSDSQHWQMLVDLLTRLLFDAITPPAVIYFWRVLLVLQCRINSTKQRAVNVIRLRRRNIVTT